MATKRAYFNQYCFVLLLCCLVAPVCNGFAGRKLCKIQSFLQKIIKKRSQNTPFCEAFFPPDDDVLPLLTGLIEAETDVSDGRIDVAAYVFTSKDLAQSLLKAYEAGVKLRVIADTAALGGRYDCVRELHHAGVAMNIYPGVNITKKYALMHNKFMIFYNLGCVVFGSMNFTQAGLASNQENIIIAKDRQLVSDFAQNFEKLLGRSTKL